MTETHEKADRSTDVENPATEAEVTRAEFAERDAMTRDLERQIAYQAARADIELNCQQRPEYPRGGGGKDAVIWYGTARSNYHAELRGQITRALAYLELRGLLVRHEKHSNRVRVLDEVN